MVKNQLGLKDIKTTDIHALYRSEKRKESKKNRDIVIQLKNKVIRDRIYDARQRAIKSSEISKRVYINDNLTKFRQKLLFDARQLV